ARRIEPDDEIEFARFQPGEQMPAGVDLRLGHQLVLEYFHHVVPDRIACSARPSCRQRQLAHFLKSHSHGEIRCVNIQSPQSPPTASVPKSSPPEPRCSKACRRAWATSGSTSKPSTGARPIIAGTAS